MAFENQVSVRPVLEILQEVACQRLQSGRLTGRQTAAGFRDSGLRRREVDAVQRQLGFQLLDLRGLLHFHFARSIGRGAASVVH